MPVTLGGFFQLDDDPVGGHQRQKLQCTIELIIRKVRFLIHTCRTVDEASAGFQGGFLLMHCLNKTRKDKTFWWGTAAEEWLICLQTFIQVCQVQLSMIVDVIKQMPEPGVGVAEQLCCGAWNR